MHLMLSILRLTRRSVENKESDFRDNKTSHPFKQVFVNKEKKCICGQQW
jgi:hypothetical protein